MMKFLTLSPLFLYVVNVAANPLRRDVNNEADVTTVVTVTETLYATLVPPVLPAVTVTTVRTQSVYTSTSTFASMLNCTTTLYTPIAAPSSVTTAVVPPTTKATSPLLLLNRQTTSSSTSTTKPSSTPTSTPTTTPTPTEVTITLTLHTTITATTSQPQRPPITRTTYISTLTTTEPTPLVRTAYACTATLEVFYSIVTDLVTSTVARTYWPSTTTVTSYTGDCGVKSTTSSSVMTKTSGMALAMAMEKRQMAPPSTVLFSTTQTQTRVSYVVTTVSETGPSTRVVRTCSPTATAAK